MDAPARSRRRHFALALGLLLAAGGALVTLAAWKARPGAGADGREAFPPDSRIPRAHGRPTLLAFIHPRCSCSRASLEELAVIAARAPGAAAITIVLVDPADPGTPGELADVRRRAAAVAGARLVDDPTRTEAARFGAHTSGQVLLYDAAGHLQFAGGITGSRGHQGDNAGRARVLALLSGRDEKASAPVFGCGLDDREEGS